MSHTVTVTRTTTSTTTSAIILNTGYCKTTPGLLKIAEVILGFALFILMTIYSGEFRLYFGSGIKSHLWLFLVVFACLVGSTCLLAACLGSLSTGSIIAKTLFELVFHGVAFLLYLITLMLYVIDQKHFKYDRHPYNTALILGLALFILMLFYSEYYNVYDYRDHAITGQMWLLLVVFACLVCSTCLLIACLFSLSTSSIIAKTFFELVYHFVAFVMYLIVVILFFINKNKPNDRHPYSTTLVLGVVLTVLYLLSTVFAYRGYRTI